MLHQRYNPACAGTTWYPCSDYCLRAIQPRVCGDYFLPPFLSLLPPDTTPRVRGLQLALVLDEADARYNPACAGTTFSPTTTALPVPIQPRVCGDYLTRRASLAISPDTTPRVRGLRSAGSLDCQRTRYNPACAGTTCGKHTRSSFSTIQPRVCGDYNSACHAFNTASDTTPRVRGLPIYRLSFG